MVKYKGTTLDRKFHALSDETRRTILVMVLQSPRSVTEITARFSISMPAVSKHLRVLEAAGLVTRKREGRTHLIQGVAGAFGELSVLIGYYETFWSKALSSLATYMEETMNDIVRVTQQINAPIEKVYSAWTDSASMAKWFTPMDNMSARVKATFEKGSSYSIAMIMEGGQELEHTGEYLEVTANKLLKFSWNSPEFKDSTVTVGFEEKDGGTLVTLTHEGLPTEESRNNHEGGWTYILECLGKELT
ncbi:MAG: metalloregulator ArsR/SmtB family transcription factor [Spirochaetales bacterium]|jgi:uncharacterized protein YndB with AHSA1/START domain|nr:metalloregulator ArsR/SmtB family transcription factor [Spirochaetales bacterium]